MIHSNYDKFPKVKVHGGAGKCVTGWEACAGKIRSAVAAFGNVGVMAVDCYPGVNEQEILDELRSRLAPGKIFCTIDAMAEESEIDRLIEPFRGGGDPVFGYMNGLTLEQFFNRAKLTAMREKIQQARKNGSVLVIGFGASMVCDSDVLIYADLPRWEAQKRFRRGETNNLGARTKNSPASLKYKRAFFIDWRVADRWKRELMPKWNFVLDSTLQGDPKLAEGDAVRKALKNLTGRPFRVVPFFDPAPWGGEWMRRQCGLDAAPKNFGWCFDCVPEENSLLLDFDGIHLEIPSINLVFQEPQALLGDAVHARFGDEFPIRFDLLDTVEGGNLSFQVHPLTEYIQTKFGMHYTQDESYYMLDAAEGATVYLGLKEGIDRDAMILDLRSAQKGGIPFPAEKYVNLFPAKKHDHFLIPAGTVHCSGSQSMVLEISATPYIFTFKMWDWGRLGLDGRLRPVHLDHGIANIQWDRTTPWVKKNLINCFRQLACGDGWREEATGLHEREFIETRRHWFTKPVDHHTRGGVNVLNLVEGNEAVVESPDGAFEPFVVHYAETFIVPAAVGNYRIRPTSEAKAFATMKAFVRTQS